MGDLGCSDPIDATILVIAYKLNPEFVIRYK